MLTKESEDKIKSYSNYLRNILVKGGKPRDEAHGMSDLEVLEAFRKCCDCGEYLYTKSQELRAILEFDSNEKIFELLYEGLNEEDSQESGLDRSSSLHKLDDEEMEEIEDEDEITIRGKWIFDGSETIDDMIKQLDGVKKYLIDLKNDNFELINTIDDDYGFLRRKENS